MNKLHTNQHSTAPIWVKIAATIMLTIGVIGITVTSVNIVRAAALSSQQASPSHHFDVSPSK